MAWGLIALPSPNGDDNKDPALLEDVLVLTRNSKLLDLVLLDGKESNSRLSIIRAAAVVCEHGCCWVSCAILTLFLLVVLLLLKELS